MQYVSGSELTTRDISASFFAKHLEKRRWNIESAVLGAQREASLSLYGRATGGIYEKFHGKGETIHRKYVYPNQAYCYDD